MKRVLNGAFVAVGLVGLAGNSFAAFNFDELQNVTKLAYDDFVVWQPDHVEHFTGYKSWLSGDDARVKVYVNHDGMNMEFNYICHKHEEGPECHRQ